MVSGGLDEVPRVPANEDAARRHYLVRIKVGVRVRVRVRARARVRVRVRVRC